VSEPLPKGRAHARELAVGLCLDCRHSKQIRSDRRSVFYMCELSASDPRFDKYPRLPVLRCPGYEPGNAAQSK
jgi:hypothetical protein